jgi:hypothetical protein
MILSTHLHIIHRFKIFYSEIEVRIESTGGTRRSITPLPENQDDDTRSPWNPRSITPTFFDDCKPLIRK